MTGNFNGILSGIGMGGAEDAHQHLIDFGDYAVFDGIALRRACASIFEGDYAVGEFNASLPLTLIIEMAPEPTDVAGAQIVSSKCFILLRYENYH